MQRFRKVALVNEHPEARDILNTQLADVKRHISSNFQLESNYPLGSRIRDNLFKARCALGDVEHELLCDLGIREQ